MVSILVGKGGSVNGVGVAVFLMGVDMSRGWPTFSSLSLSIATL